MTRRLAIAILSFALPAASLAGPEAREVRFNRPFQEGSLFSLAAIAGVHREVSVRWAGSLLENRVHDLQCEIAAAVRVVKADGADLPVEVELTIFRFGKREGDKLVPLLEKGTTVIARRKDDGWFAFFLPDGKPAEGELAEALELAVGFDTENLDALFSPGKAVKPGDRWAVDARKAAKKFESNGIVVDPDKLGSIVRYQRNEAISKDPCQVLRVEMRCPSATPELPEGMSHVSGSLEVELDTKLPLDPDLPRAEENILFNLQSIARGEKSEAAIEVRTRVSKTIRTRLAKL